jgi:hypothetical protein
MSGSDRQSVNAPEQLKNLLGAHSAIEVFEAILPDINGRLWV